MEYRESPLGPVLLIFMLLAGIAGTLAEEPSAPPEAPAAPSVRACKFVSMSWKPQFGASHTIQASHTLPGTTVVSEDDTVVINVETTCDVSEIAYASIIFTAQGQPSSKVFFLQPGKSSTKLKGNLKVADLRSLGGTAEVTISVGDAAMTPMQWYAGIIGVLDRSGDRVLPPTPSRHWAQFEVPPPLQHTFRPDQPTLPAVVPILASVVVASPLLMLSYILFAKLGANVSGMFDSISSILFAAGIAATLGLGVWFWMRMRLVDLFAPLAGLALFMVVVGHQALRGIADKRLALEKDSKGD